MESNADQSNIGILLRSSDHLWWQCISGIINGVQWVFTGLRDSCHSSVANSLLGGNWRDSGRIETPILPKNLHLWQKFHSQPMVVWIITNSQNTFLDATYILNVLQRDRDLLINVLFFSCHQPGVDTEFVKEQALYLLRTNSWRSTHIKTSFTIRSKKRGYIY